MKTASALLLLACMCFAGCSTAQKSEPKAGMKPGTPPYAVKVHQFEGCECESVCPCIFSRDTSFGDCRSMFVMTFNGHWGATKLNDTTGVLVITWSGENMEKNVGKIKGLLYTSDQGTPAEAEAVRGLVHVMLGDAFATLEPRRDSISIERKDDVHHLRLGKVGELKIHGIKDAKGALTEVRNAPSPLALPVMACGLADIHSFNDGKAKWAFRGRNAFIADYELKGGK